MTHQVEITREQALGLALCDLAEHWALLGLPPQDAWKEFQFAYWSRLVMIHGSIAATAKAKGVHRNTVARGLNTWRKV